MKKPSKPVKKPAAKNSGAAAKPNRNMVDIPTPAAKKLSKKQKAVLPVETAPAAETPTDSGAADKEQLQQSELPAPLIPAAAPVDDYGFDEILDSTLSPEVAQGLLNYRASLPSKLKIPVPSPPQSVVYRSGPAIHTPAGACPVKPKCQPLEGQRWPVGTPDNVIEEWALAVVNHGNENYTTAAVIYWARYFWDLNGPEFGRVRDVIVKTLA